MNYNSFKTALLFVGMFMLFGSMLPFVVGMSVLVDGYFDMAIPFLFAAATMWILSYWFMRSSYTGR